MPLSSKCAVTKAKPQVVNTVPRLPTLSAHSQNYVSKLKNVNKFQ